MSVPDFDRAEYVRPQTAEVTAQSLDNSEPLLGNAYPKALAYGLAGAFFGSLLYAFVGHWFILGLVSILVGWLVGTAMMTATGGVGGRKYQWTGVVLTYFAVSFAFTLDLLWEEAAKGDVMVYVSKHLLLLSIISLIGPFVALVKPASGALGLLILFFGLQSAWKIGKGAPGFERAEKTDLGNTLGLR